MKSMLIALVLAIAVATPITAQLRASPAPPGTPAVTGAVAPHLVAAGKRVRFECELGGLRPFVVYRLRLYAGGKPVGPVREVRADKYGHATFTADGSVPAGDYELSIQYDSAGVSPPSSGSARAGPLTAL